MIHLSSAAVREVTRLKTKHANPNASFRLGIESSGCYGLSYAMSFDDTINPQDRVAESAGIQIVINSQDLPYLDGLTLDYSEDLMGGGFRFHNPNAAQNCSCGNSFTLRSES